MRYRVTMEYLGTRFHGFQRQPGVPTVQGTLEEALRAMTATEVQVQGAGRTDAGVHAVGQVVAFDLEGAMEGGRIVKRLNVLLPPGISVLDAAPVREDFDPRRDASWREYKYFMLNRPAPSPIMEKLVLHCPRELDVGEMTRACTSFVGEHDFAAFRCGDDTPTVREVMECRLDPVRGDLFCVTVRAGSFMYRMVRMMCGALVAVGAGRMSGSELEEKLSGDYADRAESLPPHGLYLWKVTYPSELLDAGRGTRP